MQLAQRLGDALLDAASVAPESLLLVERVRDLVEAVVRTDVGLAERARLVTAIEPITRQLEQRLREPAILIGRHGDGRIENLTQAGSGRLNPQAPRLRFVDLPTPPAVQGEGPVPVEIRAVCTLTVAHGGPPGRAHGGVVAGLLDEMLGVAATMAGASGMTAGLNVRFVKGTPLGVELDIAARLTGSEGRKSFASGEIRAGGVVTAEATAIFVGAG